MNSYLNQIGQNLGIGSERARQIVRKHQLHLKAMEYPFALKVKELSCLGDATRTLNAHKGNEFYDGNPEKLADKSPEDLKKIVEWALKASL